ncbi:MAG: ECF-type sigma factor [Balneolales bacterium]
MNIDRIITQLLNETTGDRKGAQQKLLPLIYHDLYRMAEINVHAWNDDTALNATALVHEAYLKIINDFDKKWDNKVHFFSVASKTMRCILVDHARKQNAFKRGNGHKTLPIDEMMLCPEEQTDEIIALDEALHRLRKINKTYSEIVEYRFFFGYNIEETSLLMQVSPSTVKRNWNMARSWLYRELHRELF